MSEIKIKVCDVCVKKHSSSERRHWSDVISHVELSFKNHAGCQVIPFKGDICSDCAIKICNLIKEFIKENKPEGK